MHRRVRVPAVSLVLSASVAVASASGATGPRGPWHGVYDLGGRDAMTVVVAGGKATAALGAGHAGVQTIPVTVRAGRLVFRLPGRPGPIVFDGRARGSELSGVVRQGRLRGTFKLRRGVDASLLRRGLYGDERARLAVVDDPYPPARLVDLESGEVHGLFRRGDAFAIGAGWSTLSPEVGKASFGPSSVTVDGKQLSRLPYRQLEVRFKADGVLLAGTLTLPPGPGPHAAAVFVHGGGRAGRAYLPDLHALLLGHGVAVLAYDKRGVSQSGGAFAFQSASAATVDRLARDAAAAVRFVAAQPEIDPRRVGLFGHSQAGWVMPLAASREPRVRFLLSFAGPTATQGETDAFATATGAGASAPPEPIAEIEADIDKIGPLGVDPIPWIRSLRIPGLWLFGGHDLVVPTRLCVRRLQPLTTVAGRDLSFEVFPGANHALVETRTGLNREMLTSDRFAPGVFQSVGAWLAQHGLTSRARAPDAG